MKATTQKTPNKNGAKPKASEASADPITAITNEIERYKQEVADKDQKLEEQELEVRKLRAETTAAQTAQAKAEEARKNSDNLMEVYKAQFLELKNKGNAESAAAKDLEGKVTKLKAQMEKESAERIAAEERVKQLADRTGALVKRARDAGKLPDIVKKLEAELADEKTARGALEEKLKGAYKERDETKLELTRLKEANKDSEKLLADNAALVKKVTEAEQQILAFKNDGQKKDAEIALLKKQVTETQKALAASQEKNTILQTEVGDLRKKMDEYNKQVQQYKADKLVNTEERRKLDEENKLLQGIVMRVLQEDANRSQRKKMLQKEMERLHIQSDVMLKHISFLAESPIKLTNAERKLFKNSVLKTPSPNDLVGFLPTKPEGDPAPAPTPAPAGSEAPEAPPAEPKTPAAADTAPLPTPDPEKGAKPEKPTEIAKANPTKTPELPKAESTTESNLPPSSSRTSMDFQNLPEDAKPIAEQAKKAFESANYGDAEKLYQKAMLIAPGNLYVVSNLGVAQFRSHKYKNAEESFRRAITIAPEDSFSWCTLGIVQYSQDKFDEAVTSLTKSIAINAQNPMAHNYLGITAAQKGWIEHARKELEIAISLEPKYADAYFNLAVTFTLHKPPNLEEARKAYKKSLELGAEADSAMENTLNGDAGAVDNDPKGAGSEIP